MHRDDGGRPGLVGGGRVCAAHGESTPFAQRATADCAALFLLAPLLPGTPPANLTPQAESSELTPRVVLFFSTVSEPRQSEMSGLGLPRIASDGVVLYYTYSTVLILVTRAGSCGLRVRAASRVSNSVLSIIPQAVERRFFVEPPPAAQGHAHPCRILVPLSTG